MDEMINIQEELEKILKRNATSILWAFVTLHRQWQCALGKISKKPVMQDCCMIVQNICQTVRCKKNRITVSDAEKRQPSLLHAKLGACYARRKYGVDDRDIVEAIRWHTTGKPEMNPLEKIIFIADYIEPNRKMLPGMEQIRKASFEDLDLAMYLILKNTIAYLKETQDEDKIDTNSMQAYEYYKAVIKAR